MEQKIAYWCLVLSVIIFTVIALLAFIVGNIGLFAISAFIVVIAVIEVTS